MNLEDKLALLIGQLVIANARQELELQILRAQIEQVNEPQEPMTEAPE